MKRRKSRERGVPVEVAAREQPFQLLERGVGRRLVSRPA
jgi:hypothetical protein